VLALALAFWAALMADSTSQATASAQFCVDPLSTLVRLISIATGLILLLISWNQTDDQTAAEHHAL
jgi:NADH:ubiquinone oxidoreductase subunit 2 (subunit N)